MTGISHTTVTRVWKENGIVSPATELDLLDDLDFVRRIRDLFGYFMDGQRRALVFVVIEDERNLETVAAATQSDSVPLNHADIINARSLINRLRERRPLDRFLWRQLALEATKDLGGALVDNALPSLDPAALPVLTESRVPESSRHRYLVDWLNQIFRRGSLFEFKGVTRPLRRVPFTRERFARAYPSEFRPFFSSAGATSADHWTHGFLKFLRGVARSNSGLFPTEHSSFRHSSRNNAFLEFLGLAEVQRQSEKELWPPPMLRRNPPNLQQSLSELRRSVIRPLFGSTHRLYVVSNHSACSSRAINQWFDEHSDFHLHRLAAGVDWFSAIGKLFANIRKVKFHDWVFARAKIRAERWKKILPSAAKEDRFRADVGWWEYL